MKRFSCLLLILAFLVSLTPGWAADPVTTQATISVGNTATQVSAVNTQRHRLVLVNNGTVACYVGITSSVASGATAQTNGGILLAPNGGSWTEPPGVQWTGGYWCITASSTTIVAVLEW